MDKPPPNPKDPGWFSLKAAVDLRQSQTGDLEMAFGDLQQDTENDELDVMRRNRVSGKCEHVDAPLWKPHVIEVYLRLDGVPTKMNNQHTVAHVYRRTGIDNWLYYVWKPHFDRLYLGGAGVDSDGLKEPLLAIDRAKAVLRDLYLAKAHMPGSSKKATGEVKEECEKRGWKPPSEDRVQRAAEDLGYRPPRKR